MYRDRVAVQLPGKVVVYELAPGEGDTSGGWRKAELGGGFGCIGGPCSILPLLLPTPFMRGSKVWPKQQPRLRSRRPTPYPLRPLTMHM